MQQHKRISQPRQLHMHRPSILVLLGAAVLLALLMLAGWGSALAAPLSGAPTLNIESTTDHSVTLQFTSWASGETISLGYSVNALCSPSTDLPGTSFQAPGESFSQTITLPGDLSPGTYYLCATGSVNGTIASPQTITVNSDGTVQPTPVSPGVTPTTSNSSPIPGTSSTVPPGATGTTGPGNQGTSTTAPHDDNNSSTLVAIILLCLLVMALLAYLIRLWLQGRQPSNPPPTGGGQP